MHHASRFAAAMLAVAVAGSGLAQPIVSEGVGERRSELDQMRFKPAPMAAILGATDWIGDKPAASDLNGNAVLIFSWAEWYRPSHAVAMLANRLAVEFGDSGLVVIGVHDAEGWGEAKRFAAQRRLSYPIVRDDGGGIRRTLLVDQDPDIYVVDRAGQLRYADIATDSARAAVQEVLGEDADAAASVEQRLAQQAAERERVSRLPSGLSDNINFADLPAIAFTPPAPEEYQTANWPKAAETDNRRSNRRGDDGPRGLALPAEGWYKGSPPSAAGKVLVVYNWHPADRATMDQLMYRMDDLQRRLARDVLVVGVLAPFGDDRSRQQNPGSLESIDVSPATIEQYVGDRRLDHALVAVPSGSPVPPINAGNSRRGVSATGAVAVVSTDGIVRRAEHWSSWDEIQRTIDQVLRVDPGVKARRDAEEAYIRGGR